MRGEIAKWLNGGNRVQMCGERNKTKANGQSLTKKTAEILIIYVAEVVTRI